MDAWVAGFGAGGGPLVRNVLAKSAADVRTLCIDLGDCPELWAGATISGTPTWAASGLTIAAVAVQANGYRVQARFSGGAADTDYACLFTAVLSDGSTISRTCTLKVTT